MNFDIQGVTVAVDQSDRLGRLLLEDFSALRESAGDPDITFTTSEGFVEPPTDGVWFQDNLWVSDDRVFIDERRGVSATTLKGHVKERVGQLGYQVALHTDAADTLEVDFYYDGTLNRSSLWQALLRPFEYSYMSLSELLVMDLLYDVVEPLLHQELLRHDRGFVHASGIHYDGQGIIFPAWGGVGKTSVSSELVHHYGYGFLSDDLVPLTADGELAPYMKSVFVYPVNFDSAYAARRRLLSGRSVADRIHWAVNAKLKGAKGVRRRVRAADYYDLASATPGRVPLSKVVHLVRHEGDAFRLERTSATDLATSAASTIAKELGPYLIDISAATHTANPAEWPYVGEILARSETVYESAFDTADVFKLYIPKRTSPTALARFVDEQIV